MISQISGTVVSVGGNWAVISVSGLGLTVWSPPENVAVVTVGQSVTWETYLVIREDSLTLYGFSDTAQRDCFELLLSVSGIGPKLALATVSVLTPGELSRAVHAGDTATFTKVPGIGAKSAQRLLLELKDKVDKIVVATPDTAGAPSPWADQVRDGLMGLGWSAKEAEAACEAVADLATGPEVSVATLMRAALQGLAKK